MNKNNNERSAADNQHLALTGIISSGELGFDFMTLLIIDIDKKISNEMFAQRI